MLLPRSHNLGHLHSKSIGDIEKRIQVALLPYFGWNAPKAMRCKEQERWSAAEVELRRLLQSAAYRAAQSKTISDEEAHQYFMAGSTLLLAGVRKTGHPIFPVTEREIRTGILEDGKAGERALCVFRNFANLNITHPEARTHFLDPPMQMRHLDL